MDGPDSGCVTLDALDDVLGHDLSLEAFERAFQTLASIYLYFSQQTHALQHITVVPQFLRKPKVLR